MSDIPDAPTPLDIVTDHDLIQELIRRANANDRRGFAMIWATPSDGSGGAVQEHTVAVHASSHEMANDLQHALAQAIRQTWPG
jgi:hypothetical protein